MEQIESCGEEKIMSVEGRKKARERMAWEGKVLRKTVQERGLLEKVVVACGLGAPTPTAIQKLPEASVATAGMEWRRRLKGPSSSSQRPVAAGRGRKVGCARGGRYVCPVRTDVRTG